ncbi:glycosyltransferase family 2 protein [Tamlana fucoidanivorans]|uniref:Glycosyltransferase family 2 protein n=1 Tax=Allotamlana fucoidanivorans TaxID=2583814 RepID=A0A5C4SS53_9FLAO|nr:glycosyltransferase family 2 protein [Tamlana fucoidanivorans]
MKSLELAPLVSIITPVYNAEGFISETILSVLNQSYTNWELILINDGSTDGSSEVIQTFLNKTYNIIFFQNSTNLGAAVSRNKGIEAAQGHFIAFLDADDVWKPYKLEVQIKFMLSHNCDVSFSSYDLINENGVFLGKRVKALKNLGYTKLLKSNYIGNLTGMYNASVLGKITSPPLRKRQDWLLWLSALKQSGKPAMGIEESLAFYRVRKDSISSNKINLLKYNYWVYKKGLGFSYIQSIWLLLLFLKEHIFVKSKLVVTTKET